MKDVTAAILASGLVICLAWQEHQKNYNVSLPFDKWSNYVNGLEVTKQQLRNSDLPSKTVALLTDSLLTPMQSEISRQVQLQMQTERKVDSTKPKKN